MANELNFDLAADELEIFLADVNECLQAMEAGILSLEQKADAETLNSIFRAAHTLKAVAGTVGHQPMAELTHALETLFGQMREARVPPTLAVADELLSTVDTLKALRDEIIDRQPRGIDVTTLLARLQALPETLNVERLTLNPSSALHQLEPEQMAEAQDWLGQGYSLLEIEVVVQAEACAPAARLYQTSLALLEVGQIVTQQPRAETLAEEDTHMWLILATQSEIGVIDNLLRDVADLAEFHVQPYTPKGASQLDNSPASNAPDAVPDTLYGPDHSSTKTVRISVERLDTLLNLVGELATNRTRLLQIETMLQAQYGKSGGVSALSELVPPFSHVVNQLQDEVMRARMLPIAHLFSKFPRLVREVARTDGKQVSLLIEGEATELDRAIIEAISDPLIHLLRNAVDHGIETPEVRLAAGKPPSGIVDLRAVAAEGQIVITVADDGRGIDPVQIRQAAVGRGLLSPEEVVQLSDDEAIELIFRPNLSTVTQVTEMSGRGVGMDVVRTNIERLSGSVVVTSEPGHGTTFRLTLPLTLALVRTMLVTVQGNLYAIPVTSINGALYLAEATIHTVKGKPTLDWQDTVLPLLDLRGFFTHPRLNGKSSNGLKPTVVIVTWGKLRVGLMVDKIIGQQEIMVKALSPMVGRTPGLSGATILGDGRIAFIVDIPGLINAVLQVRKQAEV